MAQEPDFAKGVSYWNGIEPTVKGVLGGYDNVSRVDELSCRMFLLNLIPSLSTISKPHTSVSTASPERKRKALDCGAGIGRISGSVLLPLLDRVDVLESSEHFLNQAVNDSCKWPGISEKTKGVRFWKTGMQFFDPCHPDQNYAHAKTQGAESGWDEPYDVIWIQWCLGHLSNADLVSFLQRCRNALRQDDSSYIIVKENTSRKDALFDDDDSSIMRTDQDFKKVFERAGLRLVKEELQRGFPKELYPVKT